MALFNETSYSGSKPKPIGTAPTPAPDPNHVKAMVNATMATAGKVAAEVAGVVQEIAAALPPGQGGWLAPQSEEEEEGNEPTTENEAEQSATADPASWLRPAEDPALDEEAERRDLLAEIATIRSTYGLGSFSPLGSRLDALERDVMHGPANNLSRAEARLAAIIGEATAAGRGPGEEEAAQATATPGSATLPTTERFYVANDAFDNGWTPFSSGEVDAENTTAQFESMKDDFENEDTSNALADVLRYAGPHMDPLRAHYMLAELEQIERNAIAAGQETDADRIRAIRNPLVLALYDASDGGYFGFHSNANSDERESTLTWNEANQLSQLTLVEYVFGEGSSDRDVIVDLSADIPQIERLIEEMGGRDARAAQPLVDLLIAAEAGGVPMVDVPHMLAPNGPAGDAVTSILMGATNRATDGALAEVLFPEPEVNDPSWLESFLAGAANSLLFNWDDEILGFLIGTFTDLTISEGIEQRRRDTNNAEEANPEAFNSGQAAGIAGQMLLLPGVGAIGTIDDLVRVAATNAGINFLAGAGAGTTTEGRLSLGGLNALIGAGSAIWPGAIFQQSPIARTGLDFGRQYLNSEYLELFPTDGLLRL